MVALSAFQAPAVRAVDETALREYTGVYRWEPDAFVYLQMWNEFSGFDKPSELVAFDESGEVRTLYPTGRDQFFAGPGMAVSASIESRIEFQRDGAGKIASLTWHREGAAPASRRRVEIEKREDVRFSSGARSADRHAHQSGRGGETSRDRSRARLRRRESGIHASRGRDSWFAAAWPSSATTSAVLADRPATGTRPRSTIWPAMWWLPSST